MTDLSDDEALAAEYVLGTLDAAERTAAEARRRQETAFDGLVTGWESRLAPLAEAATPLAPPPALFERILAALPPSEWPGGNDGPGDNILIMRQKLRTWRRVAVATSALAAALALWIVAREALVPDATRQTYVAVLQHGTDTPSFLVSVDLASRRMVVMPLATSAPPGKSYELWVIGPGQAPRSMGVMAQQAATRTHLPDLNDAVLSDATYAVTVEPPGGSPTGQPTSAPVFAGKLVHAAL